LLLVTKVILNRGDPRFKLLQQQKFSESVFRAVFRARFQNDIPRNGKKCIA
jgi:hypothetical protein